MLIADTITERLQRIFTPNYLKVDNESNQHQGGIDAQTHFKVIVVSDTFQNITLLQRHRQVYDCLSDLIHNPIHALSVHAFTVTEWQTKTAEPKSPPCLGGSHREKQRKI